MNAENAFNSLLMPSKRISSSTMTTCSSDFWLLPTQMLVAHRSSRDELRMESGVRYQRRSPNIAILPPYGRPFSLS